MKLARNIAIVLVSIFALWWWQGGADRRVEPPQAVSPSAPQRSTSQQSTSPSLAASKPAGETAARVPPYESSAPARALPDFLPKEAHKTIELILGGGPFPHRQDGAVFGNREKRLPPQPRGYYREYTVRTPGERDRGARRIVAGGEPPREFWYTADHYETFRRFEVPR